MSGAMQFLFFVAIVSAYRAVDLHWLAENGVILADGSASSLFRLNEYALRFANREAVA